MMGISMNIQKKLGEFELSIQLQSESSRIGILGASGCGKSLTLKSIAGIETPDQGEILVNGVELFQSEKKINVKPQKRNIGYLFQNYALFPHMTVEQNIAIGLRGTKEEQKKRVQEMIQKFRLTGLEKHLPGQLSGGQQQRTALARIMAYEPDMILLDEPFSALDGFLKDRLQVELEEMLEDYKGTVIMVSHSRDEVYRFCEELVILDQGSVVVSGKTKALFSDPQYMQAAKLTGCKNFLEIQRMDSHRAVVKDWNFTLQTKKEIPEDCTYIGYRAHDLIPIWGEKSENCFAYKVRNLAELPFERQYYISSETEKGELCWFIQQNQYIDMEEKGMPDYLQLEETKCMFLKER